MISAEEFARIEVGDTVRLVDKWDRYTEENWDGYMDIYLGSVWVVSGRDENYLRLVLPDSAEEWEWNRFCIEEIINSTNPIEYNSDFSSLI